MRSLADQEAAASIELLEDRAIAYQEKEYSLRMRGHHAAADCAAMQADKMWAKANGLKQLARQGPAR